MAVTKQDLQLEVAELRVRVEMQKAEIDRLTDLLARAVTPQVTAAASPAPGFDVIGPAAAAGLQSDDDDTAAETRVDAATAGILSEKGEIEWVPLTPPTDNEE